VPQKSRTIGAFAEVAGVDVETIRLYQHKGPLSTPQWRYSNIRRYGTADVAQMKLAKAARRPGFNLDQVRARLQLELHTHFREAAELAAWQLTDVRAKLTDLNRIEAALSKLGSECRAHHDNVSCPLIAASQRR
jgi:MerR family mercuric resistance operon transcriptional regulator